MVLSEYGNGDKMRYAILENNIVVNVAEANAPFNENWIDATGAKIGDTWTGTEFITPEPEPEPVVLDVLATDTWTIPADSTTFATVTYTDDTTVYFSVNEAVHAVEPVEQTATLEITADVPGPIRVEVKDKQLIITALEVTV